MVSDSTADVDAYSNYAILQHLGRGSRSQVTLARDKASQELVALKVLPAGVVTPCALREALRHSRLHHPHVIQLRGVVARPGELGMVLEYASEGSLFNLVQRSGRLQEPIARWLFQQLIVGLDYCHAMGAAGLGVTLHNTLLQASPGSPLPLLKIGSFASYGAEADPANVYAAPEHFAGGAPLEGARSAAAADVWACGVMLYAMPCGHYPFVPLSERAGRLDAPQAPAFPDSLPPACRDLASRMLEPDPKRRITVAGIMAHPWFKAGLPFDAAELNARVMRTPQPSWAPGADEIREAARRAAAPPAARGPAGPPPGGADETVGES